MTSSSRTSVRSRSSPESSLASRLGGLHVLVDSVALAEAALAGGAPVIQVRTKAGTDRERLGLVEAIAARCKDAGALCLVNDRVDLALAAGADGVHLGADDVPVERARAIAPPGFAVGGTARDRNTAQQLVRAGADYLGVGPVWATASKDGLPDPIGLDGLRAVTAAVDVPVVAISGVTAARVPEALAAGAAGAAVISAVCSADEPEVATRQLVAATRPKLIAKSDRHGRITPTEPAGGRPDVAVVGGGIIGLACAWRLAQRELAVTVVDPTPASGASHVAAGMLAPVTEVHYGEEALLALNLESARRWPAFAGELAHASGMPVDFDADGTIAVGFDNDDRAALDMLGSYLDRLGLQAERLRSREARHLEPMLAPTIRGGLAAEGDRRVDPRTVTTALRAACEELGVTFVGGRATGLAAENAGLAGYRIRLDGGRCIDASSVVLATGATPDTLDGLHPAAVPPVRPVKGQILTVRCPPGQPLLTRAVRGIVQGTSVYLVPRHDGRIVIGATVEEQGWDGRPTAGAVYELLRDASLLVPGISECELVETLVGFRPGTPDNAPILGACAAMPGLVHATGHYRNGVLLTPVTADAIAELVATGTTPDVIAPFGIDRFNTHHGAAETAPASPETAPPANQRHVHAPAGAG